MRIVLLSFYVNIKHTFMCGIIMTNNLNIKNIDDLMYMVGSSFECLKQNEYNKINDEYHNRLKNTRNKLNQISLFFT